MTRVIVCGGRDFDGKDILFRALDEILPQYSDVEIVSGHAKGADAFGEEYAETHNIPVAIFKADWKRYGGGAGPIRNRQMFEYASKEEAVIVAFWDGSSPGTKNMIDKARKSGAKVHIIHYRFKLYDGKSKGGTALKTATTGAAVRCPAGQNERRKI